MITIEKSSQKIRLEQIANELDKSERRYRYYDQQVKILQSSMKTMNRKERTHRLCTRGGMLESFLVMPGDLTDDQIMEILKVAFRQQTVRETLEAMLSVVKEAKDYGCGTIYITASNMGVKLYESYGFHHNGNFMQYNFS